MNLHAKTIKRTEVTTGPLTGSRKIYSAPDDHADLRVPLREIDLAEGATFRVYDTSGPYTDPEAEIDVQRGLPALRKAWIEARRSLFSPPPQGRGLVTQLELARAGIVTQEMVYIAHRENSGASVSGGSARPRKRKRGSQTARASVLRSLHLSRRNSCGAKWRAAARSSPPISTTPNPSR